MLLCAFGLGVFSLTEAGRNALASDDQQPWNENAILLAWMALAMSTVQLLALAVARTTRSAFVAFLGVAISSAAIIYFFVAAEDIWASFQLLSQAPLRSEQLPTAAMAWVLAAVGSVAAALVVAPLSRFRRSTFAITLVVSLVLAGVGSAGAVWWSLRSGDDSRFVEATHAADVSVPDVPAVSGERAFSRKVSDRNEVETARDGSAVMIAAAGPGFVLLHDGTLTAYDSEGEQRWHYRRTGPDDVRINDANVYDDSRTVIVRIGRGPDDDATSALVALDAMTGTQLWASTDALRLHAFGLESNMWPLSPSPMPARFLIARGQERWTAFDPRTGTELWSTEYPRYCGQPDAHLANAVFEAASAVIVFTQCSVDGYAVTVAASVIDPQTGRQTVTQPIADRLRPRESGREHLDVSLVAAGNGVVYSITAESGDVIGYFSADGDVAHPSLARYSLVGSNDPDRDFLAVVSGTDGVHAVFGSDARWRCRVPSEPDQSISNRDLTWLRDEFVVLMSTMTADHEFNQVLQSFDRDSCAPAARVELPWESVRGMGAVPGLLLVLRTDDEGTFLDGYR